MDCWDGGNQLEGSGRSSVRIGLLDHAHSVSMVQQRCKDVHGHVAQIDPRSGDLLASFYSYDCLLADTVDGQRTDLRVAHLDPSNDHDIVDVVDTCAGRHNDLCARSSSADIDFRTVVRVEHHLGHSVTAMTTDERLTQSDRRMFRNRQ